MKYCTRCGCEIDDRYRLVGRHKCPIPMPVNQFAAEAKAIRALQRQQKAEQKALEKQKV